MTMKAWRLLALLALAACFSLTAAVVWVALAYGSNLKKISDGAQICLAGSRAYDSVAAAQMIGRLDLVSFLLTVGGLLLAVFALMGFWMIRREALDEASRVAADEARKVAQIYYGLDQNESGTYVDVNRASAESQNSAISSPRSQTLRRDTQEPNFDPSTVSVAGATEERSGAGDAESA
jgi:hypothetical protein